MNTDSRPMTPGRILELSGYYWKTCTLHAAVKLDVFTQIGSREKTASEIAQALHVDERALLMLLNALSAISFLVKKENRFANTKESAIFLSKDSDKYVGQMIMHHHHLVQSWANLDEAVKSGNPLRNRATTDENDRRESFLMSMFNIGMSIAPQLANQIDLSGRRHLIDVGGGPGAYAIHFCMKNPKLKATVYDLSTTRPFAEKTIDRFGVSDQVDFVDGDYLKESIPGAYDVAWISHILHAEGPDDCQVILNKVVACLKPGGMMMIHDFILENSMDKPIFPALFALNMVLGTQNGQSYSEKQIMDMLFKAGAVKIKRLPFVGPTESGILTATF